jgi:hypothetical protein
LAVAQGVDELDGHAVAGFAAARSFLQRADDADMLLDIARVTGLGRLYAVPARRSTPEGRCLR